MKTFTVSLAVAALITTGAANKIKQMSAPDIFGPNGNDYQNISPEYDMSRIGISIDKHGTGPQCTIGDWVTVHWVGRLKDGRVVTDSKMEGDQRPKTFTLGDHQVFKCWDEALTQLKQGDVATLDCPSFYAYGDAFTWPPVGGEPIPLNSDIDFEIEVMECGRTPEFVAQSPQPVTTTMQSGQCMWLHWDESQSLRDDLVLSTTTLPNETGVMELTKLERLLKDDPQMEWYYDYATGQLHNGVGWAYNLANDKLENNGQKIETLDHLTALGQNTHEIDNGSNAGFVGNEKDNQFNKGADAAVRKNIFYDPDTRQLTTFYNGIHYHLATPIDPHHEGPKVGTFL